MEVFELKLVPKAKCRPDVVDIGYPAPAKALQIAPSSLVQEGVLRSASTHHWAEDIYRM
jgi:hypothetical protein